MKEDLQAQRRTMMLDTPLHKLIPKMALPTIVAMLINSIYSLADTFFVSSLGTSATAAVGVNVSIDNIIMMAGSFLAVGANSYIARLLGAKKEDEASSTLSTAFFCGCVFGLLVTVLGLVFTKNIVVFIGAVPSVVPYAMEYARFILLASPFMVTSFILSHCLRSEGSPIFSMMGMGIGGIINIILDPIFIFALDLGVAGAAIATTISKIIGFGILIFPYITRRSVLKLSVKNVCFASDIVREICLMGAPSLLRIGFTVVGNIVMNNLAGAYSDSAIAAVSVVSRIIMFPVSAVLGFGQGFQPVAGYNWGAKRYDRVKKSFHFSGFVIFLGTVIISACLIIFARPLILKFTEDDGALVEVGVLCLRARAATLPLAAWIILVNFLYSAIGRPAGALLLGVTREGAAFLPAVWLLNSFFGLNGLAISQATADFLSLSVGIPFAVHAVREIKRRDKEELPPDANISR